MSNSLDIETIKGFYRIPMGLLDQDVRNARRGLVDVDHLAESIARAGLFNPLGVVPEGGRFRIQFGHRRFAALKLLGFSSAPCLVHVDSGDPLRDRARGLLENIERVALNPMEEAYAVQDMRLEFGMSDGAICGMLHRSQMWLTQRRALVELSEQDQQRVAHGDLGIKSAYRKVIDARSDERGTSMGPNRRGWYFGVGHPLAAATLARCNTAGHARTRRLGGGQGCGICWEEIIRIDEHRKGC